MDTSKLENAITSLHLTSTDTITTITDMTVFKTLPIIDVSVKCDDRIVHSFNNVVTMPSIHKSHRKAVTASRPVKNCKKRDRLDSVVIGGRTRIVPRRLTF